MIWVIDASVAVRWFIEQESHKNADSVLERMLSQPERFAVPELFCFEVYAVLCRIHPHGAEVFIKGMIPVINCGILRYPMTKSLVLQANDFVNKGLTGYDACHAALAKELKGMWLTFDDRAHRIIEKARLSYDITKSMPRNWKS
jgi:predicted nucleic acid-binding protein